MRTHHRHVLRALASAPDLPVEDVESLRALLPQQGRRWALESMLERLEAHGLARRLTSGAWTLSPDLGRSIADRRAAALAMLEG